MEVTMRHAYTLLGIMTLVIFVGACIAFSKKAEAPITTNSINPSTMSLSLTSPVFNEGGSIPLNYTCDGENVSPELHIDNVPEGTKSFVLVMDDPDIPDFVKKERGIEKFNHWALYNIPAETRVLKEGEIIGMSGVNGRGEAKYTGPCPPDREHRYMFRLYAVTGQLNFLKAPTLDEVETAARGMMLASSTLIGTYKRVSRAE
jgi:Raf kinase inhibitor-like YbhB/YbcL family protein